MTALDFQPVTPERWDDLVQLFSAHGNPNYCWCQYWRMSSSDYSAARSPERKAALAASVQAGTSCVSRSKTEPSSG